MLYAWESVEMVNQFLKLAGKTLLTYSFLRRQFSRETLSSNFSSWILGISESFISDYGSLWMFIPRYITQFLGSSLYPLKFSFNRTPVCFLANLNKTTSVLLIFKQIYFAFIQLVRFQSWITSRNCRFILSTKWWTYQWNCTVKITNVN